MIRCPKCQKVSSPRSKTHLVVVSTRHYIFPPRYREVKGLGGKPVLVCIDKGGQGSQITKEVRVCHPCFTASASRLT